MAGRECNIASIGVIPVQIHSLRTKLTFFFFIFFFVPFGVLTFLSISMSREMMHDSTVDHLRNLVEVKETAIEQWLKERVADGKSIAESPEIKSLNPGQIEPFLSLMRHFERSYLNIQVYTLNGELVSRKRSEISSMDEEWFKKALQEGVFISIPGTEPGHLRPTVTISTIIRNAQQRPIGILKEVVSLTFLTDLITESKLGQTGTFFIFCPQGEFVIQKGLIKAFKREASSSAYFEVSPGKPTYTGVYKGYTENNVLGSWKWISGLRCYLIAEQDSKEAFYQIDMLMEKAVIIFIISTLLIILISSWVIRRTTTPITQLGEAVAEFADGHFGETVTTTRVDEIGKLINGFNTMAEKLNRAHEQLEGKGEASNKELEAAYQLLKKRQEQLIQSEKMAALGELSAGIAHEIRNPMTSIRLFVQSLEKEIDLDESQQDDFRIIIREIDRMNEKITRLLNFARPEEPEFEPIQLGDLVGEAVNLLEVTLKEGGIRLDIDIPEAHPPLEGDPRQLSQVLVNLILNAAGAMPHGGILTISAIVEDDPQNQRAFLRLTIKDTGHGILEKDRPYLFDPFFTTKSTGTGLGLSIAYSVVRMHNGRIDVESEWGKGSSFTITLPVQKEEKGDNG
jgi:two-component system, NtrC family, sensor kinase